jgi:hypothetical protein
MSGTNWTLSGNAPWASFQLKLTASSPTSDGQPSGNALIGLTLKVTPSKDAPTDPGPDVTLVHAPAAALKEYAAAPPVAGNNLFLSNTQLRSTILYFSNYTALGPYFDRTRSGVTQPNFPYFACRHQGVAGRRVPGLLRLRSAAQQSRLATPQEDDCCRFQLSLPRARDPVR